MKIPLTLGLFATVDADDFELLVNFKWQARPVDQAARRFYAARSEGGTTVYMHRVILNVGPGITVDHIDGDGLNNKRDNLRPATRSQNNANREARNAIGYRGVFRKKNRFKAMIAKPRELGSNTKCIHLGYFPTPEEAARAYDAAAKARWGEFARLNFPEHQ